MNDTSAPQPPESTPAAPPRKENIKETIESILVAFILAFVFRAFVVEAFVIPSGSMAPTLLGAHMRYRCQECGYQFDVNYPTKRGKDEMNIKSMAGPDSIISAHCPNCGLKVPVFNPADPEYGSARNSPVHYGDRILVLKYLYLVQEPQRWDVVVFKSPQSPEDYDVNFIKRLVGKPGEAIMILDGDIYATPDFEGSVDSQPWKIQTKPRHAQNALWRIVYDNDFQPRNDSTRLPRWQSPWRPTGQGWKADNGMRGRILRFDNPAGLGKLSFDKDANVGEYPLTDWLPYNEVREVSDLVGNNHNEEAYGNNLVPRWYVNDLKLQFSYSRSAGDGELRATLTKLKHEFTAVFNSNSAKLLHRLPNGQVKTIDEAKLDFAGASPLMVEFANVDYTVSLRVNGREIIRSTPDQYAPDLSELLEKHRGRDDAIRAAFGIPRVEIAAERQTCEISHLSLWRDVYYTPNIGGALTHGSPENPIKLHRRDTEHENEYFVLGDNSILSGDARTWRVPVDLPHERLRVQSGCVPERFLLGKAFFVYWPAGYRPFSPTMPGLVPNFGEMRFIR